MTRAEIIDMFRVDNPEITSRVISDARLHNWTLIGDKEICAETRCIVDNGTPITTAENDESFDLTAHITNFYDIDDFPGSGVLYDEERLEKVTMAQLDEEDINWRSNSSGTPEKYYKRGRYIFLDRPIDSNAEDLVVYSVLLSTDFDNDIKTPYNELPYLEPFHYAIVLYLQKKAKMKVGKRNEELKAVQEFNAYVKWMKKMLIGGRHGAIQFRPPIGRYSTS